MKPEKSSRYLVPSLAIVLFVAFFVALGRPLQESPAKSQSQQPVQLIHSLDGADLFHAYCASCHGADAKGAGPVASALTSNVPDLTTISKRNGGIFPSKRIEQIVAGNGLIIAHGSREMPIWGPIFHQIQEDRDLGNIRLHNVTKYIESIQQK
jgi:hypothetical protein